MARPLTLDQIRDIIELHPSAFAALAGKKSIGVDDIAHAVSVMAVDPAVSRTVVAMATGRPSAEVAGGFATWVTAGLTIRDTLKAHSQEDIGVLFYEALAPGFGTETGTIQ
jgi:hypothetical protein